MHACGLCYVTRLEMHGNDVQQVDRREKRDRFASLRSVGEKCVLARVRKWEWNELSVISHSPRCYGMQFF